jgi:hypothetical protein
VYGALQDLVGWSLAVDPHQVYKIHLLKRLRLVEKKMERHIDKTNKWDEEQ